ncbi:MAG: glycosyltransferase [Bacteroidetes bacterium]|nr:glycosyltransferase [Bacteroidota bacterium]
MAKINYFIGRFVLKVLSLKHLDRLISLLLIKYIVFKVNRLPKQGVASKPRLFFGPVPIINNKYYSGAMSSLGYKSQTVMTDYYSSINKKADYDIYREDILKEFRLPVFLKQKYSNFLALYFALKNYDIFHLSYFGCFLGKTEYREYEADIFKSCGKKVVIMAYGADSYMYSKVIDPSLRHALLLSYPLGAIDEEAVQKRVAYWQKNADAIVGSIMVDGFGRWDVLTPNYLVIDTQTWAPKRMFNEGDGVNGVVTIVHTPNHRGFKGTEFIKNAVEELQKEGLMVKLILLENIQNDEVKRILFEEADILAEQLFFIGYAMSGIEGMATGLPVLSNLSNENYTLLQKRFSFLNECPVLSTTPETIKENIKQLVKNPSLRKELGVKSRAYVEKYHSYTFIQYLFEKVYDKIWYKKENVDLLNLFHPLNPESYNNKYPNHR